MYRVYECYKSDKKAFFRMESEDIQECYDYIEVQEDSLSYQLGLSAFYIAMD